MVMVPHDLAPTSDAVVGGWVNEDKTTPLWSHLGSGDHIESLRRFRDGPKRVLLLSSDDGSGRSEIDYGATITTCAVGARVGQLARYNMMTRVAPKATRFRAARTDHSPCSPGRAAFTCGDRSCSHGNTRVSQSEYFDYIRHGVRDTHLYDGQHAVRGPIEKDCNAIAAEAFYSTINTATATTYNSGTAYTPGQQVKRSITGTGGTFTHYFVCVTAGTNKTPETNCTGAADFWRHYGTAEHAALMRRQQAVDAWLQPYFGHLTGGRRDVWYGRANGDIGSAPNAEDDLQKTGGLPTWLSYTGRIKCYGLEKFQNGIGLTTGSDAFTPYTQTDATTIGDYWAPGTFVVGNKVAYNGIFYTCNTNVTSSTPPSADPSHWTVGTPAYTTRHVSPGWRRFVMSADDVQDHYRNNHIDFDELVGGLNPASSPNGQIGTTKLLQYDWDVNTISYNSGTNKVTVTTTTDVDIAGAGLTIGGTGLISVDYSTSGVAVGGTNWVEPEITATIVDAHTFTYTPTATPTGTPTVTDLYVYVRNLFEPIWYANEHIKMLDDVSEFDNIFIYHGFHIPHWSAIGTGGVRDDVNTQNERRYENSKYSAVPRSQAFYWNGTSGTAQPSIPSPYDSDTTETSNRAHWARRQNMFASQDDALGMILDAWDAKFGVGNYYIIYIDDNGYQYASHRTEEGDASAPVGGKVYTWENSVVVSMFIVGPEFAQGVDSYILVELADIPLTILDIFSGSVPDLKTHHAHTKRDGTSIIRKLRGEASLKSMSWQFIRGKYQSGDPDGTGPGAAGVNHVKIIDKDGNALPRLWNGVIETGSPTAWVSGQAVLAGQQRIYSGQYYTCTANTVSPHLTNPSLDTSHYALQYRRLFLGDGVHAGMPDPSEDEMTDHQNDNGTTLALADALSAKLSEMMIWRWEPTTSTHTGKT